MNLNFISLKEKYSFFLNGNLRFFSVLRQSHSEAQVSVLVSLMAGLLEFNTIPSIGF